jgi:hypothetical protein
MKAKTNVKAGDSYFVTNIAANVSRIRQRGFANYAEVYQTAIAASA